MTGKKRTFRYESEIVKKEIVKDARFELARTTVQQILSLPP